MNRVWQFELQFFGEFKNGRMETTKKYNNNVADHYQFNLRTSDSHSSYSSIRKSATKTTTNNNNK